MKLTKHNFLNSLTTLFLVTSQALGAFTSTETWQGVGDYVTSTEYARDFGKNIVIGADALGVLDPTPISDGVSGLTSLALGDKGAAALSVAAMVPYVGDVGKVAKYGLKYSDEAAAAIKHIDNVPSGNLNKTASHQLKQAGINEHTFKAEYVGSQGGKYNISVDTKTGNIELTPVQKGSGPNIPTGRNINEF